MKHPVSTQEHDSVGSRRVSCTVDALQGDGVRQLCVVLHAAANATVFERPAHSSGVGEEPTALQLPIHGLGGPQLQRTQRDSGLTPTDLTEHWAEGSGVSHCT